MLSALVLLPSTEVLNGTLLQRWRLLPLLGYRLRYRYLHSSCWFGHDDDRLSSLYVHVMRWWRPRGLERSIPGPNPLQRLLKRARVRTWHVELRDQLLLLLAAHCS
jgi:hypothetical protein